VTPARLQELAALVATFDGTDEGQWSFWLPIVRELLAHAQATPSTG
jgi:hypothetical protein